MKMILQSIHDAGKVQMKLILQVLSSMILILFYDSRVVDFLWLVRVGLARNAGLLQTFGSSLGGGSCDLCELPVPWRRAKQKPQLVRLNLHNSSAILKSSTIINTGPEIKTSTFSWFGFFLFRQS